MFTLWSILPDDWMLVAKVAVIATVILFYLGCFAVAIYSEKSKGFLGFTLLVFLTLPGALIIIDIVSFGLTSLVLHAIWITAVLILLAQVIQNIDRVRSEDKVAVLAAWSTISIATIVLGILVGLFASGMWFVFAAFAVGLAYFAGLAKFEEKFGLFS